MEKQRFVDYCARYLCDKDTAVQYVENANKEQYGSVDADAVYKLYIKKLEEKAPEIKAHGRSMCRNGDFCHSSKRYDGGDPSDR